MIIKLAKIAMGEIRGIKPNEREDLLQQAIYEIVKASKRAEDNNRHTKRDILVQLAKWGIIREMNKVRNITTNYEDFHEETIENKNNDTLEELNVLIKKANLSPQEIQVIKDRYYHNKTLKQIGDKIGTYPEMVRLILKRAMKKLRENERT